MSRPVPAPTQPSIYVIGTGGGGSSLERSKAAGIKSETIPQLPLYAFMVCPETNVYLYFKL